MIRVLVVDDHPTLRAGVLQAIKEASDIEVVGEAATGPELWASLAELRPDVVLLDLQMPGFDPFEDSSRIQEQHPDTAIVVLTNYGDEQHIQALVKAGAAGYLLKEEDADTVVRVIRKVAVGKVSYSEDVLAKVGRGTTTPPLTRRERQVLKLVAQGKTSEQIARELMLVKRTVDFHVENACRKLEVDNRTAAAAKASELELITVWKQA
jgi:DNA-binding NarL/FixJ family response regulator